VRRQTGAGLLDHVDFAVGTIDPDEDLDATGEILVKDRAQ
jgi:hypothetical protein